MAQQVEGWIDADSRDLLNGTPHTMNIRVAVRGWHPQLCGGLRRILVLAPEQPHLFRNVFAHAAAHGAKLAAEAGPDRKHQLDPENYPLASLVMAYPPAPKVTPIQRTLSWLVLEAHLSGAGGHLVDDLAQIVRGLFRGETSKLNQTILECSGPSRLLAKMQRLGQADPTRITGHGVFDALWNKELSAFCVALVREEVAVTDNPDELVVALDHPTSLTESPLDSDREDPDESPFEQSLPIGTGQVIRGQSLRSGIDWAGYMARRSSPNLLRPPDNVLPSEVRELEWMKTIVGMERALAGDALQEAEYFAVALLSIEAGLSAKEAVATVFGNSTASGPAVDLQRSALRRPEVLPLNCFTPAEDDERWLPTGGDAIFPLSPRAVELLEAFATARAKASSGGSSLLVRAKFGLNGRLSGEAGTRLWAAASPVNRLVLAVNLANSLGIDAAQRAFGDTFGLSAAATYYGAFCAADIAIAIARANGFMNHDLQSAPWISAATHVLGSRVRPLEPPYASAWEKLRGGPGRPRGRPSDRDLASDWRLRRDRLLVHFILATGHRPTQSLFELTLHGFMPREAMAFVSDKVVGSDYVARPVCTGRKFMGELEGYLHELRRISLRSGIKEARSLARRVLNGSAPLFVTLQESQTAVPSVSALLKELNPLWGSRPNVHRHGLAQYLIAAGVDPEERYLQMGWQCHDHHATSDSSPYPASSLGSRLSGVIDEWLDQCGWLGGAPPRDSDLIRPLPLVDWAPKKKELEESEDLAWKTLRAELAQTEDALEASTWTRIREEADVVLLGFQPVPLGKPPAFEVTKVADGEVPAIGPVEVEGMLAAFNKRSSTASERYVAARVLKKALLRTARVTGARVYLPSVPMLARRNKSSPYLPDAGLAIAQSNFLYSALIRSLVGKRRGSDATDVLVATAAIAILLHTQCATLAEALDTLGKAEAFRHAEIEPWQVRVTTNAGHALIGGDDAILIRQMLEAPGHKEALERLARNNCEEFGAIVVAIVPELVPIRCRPQGFVRLIECTAGVAKPFWSNGAERLLLVGAVTPPLVDAARAASVADGVTLVPTGGHGEVEGGPPDAHVFPHGSPAHRPLRRIEKVMRAFDPDFHGQILGNPAKPVAKRTPQLKRLLEDALRRMDGEPTAGRLILEYSWHLLVEGGPKSRGGQRSNTIWTTYHRLAPILRSIGWGESLEVLKQVELTGLVRACCEKSRRKSSRRVLDDLKRFFQFVRTRCQIEEPDWSLLFRTYGIPAHGGDPGLVGGEEASRVLERLHTHIVNLSGTDAGPSERRFREVILVAALIAEATAARPRSIHGLTLGDIVLGDRTDYIHLRSSGKFASIKTSTAAGYIPMEGHLWQKYRSWMAKWVCRCSMGVSAEKLGEIPLFQIPGEPLGVRFEIEKVFQVSGALLRWSTRHPRARTYWLRKRRINERHRRVMTSHRPMARDVVHAMKLSGHALLLTPLGSYLAEPSTYLSGVSAQHLVSTRTGTVAMAKIRCFGRRQASAAEVMDIQARVAKLLSLGKPVLGADSLPEPPRLPTHGSDLSRSTIERALRDVAAGVDAIRIASRHGIERGQMESIMFAQRALAVRLKAELGFARNDLSPPRPTDGAKVLLRLLEDGDDRLTCIAKEWVGVAEKKRLGDGCQLADPEAIHAFRNLIGEQGVRIVESEADHGTVLFRIRGWQDSGRSSRSAYGLWAALRWVLCVAWVADYRRRHQRDPQSVLHSAAWLSTTVQAVHPDQDVRKS